MKYKRRVLLIVETSRAYGRGIIRGVSQYINEHESWEIDLEDRGIHELSLGSFHHWKGDGIIARSPTFEQHLALKKKAISFVELLGDEKSFFSEVRSDEEKTAVLAAEHFLSQGHRNFAFFTMGKTWWASLREKHYVNYLQKKGWNVHLPPLVFRQLTSQSTLYPEWNQRLEKPLLNWLSNLPKPIALWASSDVHAVRILQACRRAELVVPKDVAILGTTNDTVLCKLQNPSLSSIDINSVMVGYQAARLLDFKMNLEQRSVSFCSSFAIRKTESVLKKVGDIQEISDIRQNEDLEQKGLSSKQIEGAEQEKGLGSKQIEGAEQEKGLSSKQIEGAEQEKGLSSKQIEGTEQEKGLSSKQNEGAEQEKGARKKMRKERGRKVWYSGGNIPDYELSDDKTLKFPINIPPVGVVVRTSSDLVATSDEDVVQSLMYIQQFAFVRPTISFVAEEIGLSKSTLQRKFKKELGISPEAELIRIRLQTAKSLLLETDLPIGLIAKKIGFSAPEYFSRSFRRDVGISPSQFRLRFRKNQNSGDEL